MSTVVCYIVKQDLQPGSFVLGQVSDTLKKFAVKVTTSSIKERKEIIEELKQCIIGKGKATEVLQPYNCSTEVSYTIHSKH